MKCTKAIIPVAGYGTRRLPITRAIEKSMLPVLNRPVVDYIVEDCMKAGIREFYFVVGENSSQIHAYYRRNPQFEAYLRETGKERKLPLVMPPEDCQFNFVVQPNAMAYGTAVPVSLCDKYIDDDEQALVIMGDNFFWNKDGSSGVAQFLQAAETAHVPSALLAYEVPKEEVYKYGIFETVQRDGVELFHRVIEKPSVEDAPTNLSNPSYYLFDKHFFHIVAEYMKQERTDEYFITDPLNMYMQAGHDIAVIRAQGEFLDCGNVDGWVYANQRVYEDSKAA
jgi:UTP--glucose-1-phosphate uridylyltransferase